VKKYNHFDYIVFFDVEGYINQGVNDDNEKIKVVTLDYAKKRVIGLLIEAYGENSPVPIDNIVQANDLDTLLNIMPKLKLITFSSYPEKIGNYIIW